MKRYSLSFADSLKHVPEHPERTAYHTGRALDFDIHYQVWTSRAAMLKTIEMQEKGPPRSGGWRACKVQAAA